MENNLDFADVMIEVVRQKLTSEVSHNEPITWDSLLTALIEYREAEEAEIKRLRKWKRDNRD